MDITCDCGARLIVDEGPTVRIALKNWRVNKATRRVTATCPRCPKEHVIRQGNLVREHETILPVTDLTAALAF